LDTSAGPDPDAVPRGPLVHRLHDGPDVPSGIAGSRRAAAAARRVIAGLTGTRADAATVHEVAAALEHLAATLEPYRPDTRWGQTSAGFGVTANPHAWEAHPLIGPSNAFAPPVRVERHGDRAVGFVRFGHVYEGPPGAVHGGVVAAVFDVVVISAAAIAGVPGLTGTLTVRYLAATPLGRVIRFEGRLEEVRGRTVVVRGRSTDNGTVLAEAEGILVRPRAADAGSQTAS
jgi:acyl-coenzyme A thioesterase PaaI-like protein